MTSGLLETMSQADRTSDQRFYGAALAQVVNNIDALGLGRVQVRLPWMPEFEPWARVVTPMAGSSMGVYFLPQVGDEVLVAFNHGDVREPYVLGGLWNARDRPPGLLPTDPVAKRIIRTPAGHQIEFDDLTQSVTVTSSTQQRVKLGPEQIELTTTGGAASVTLSTAGSVSVRAAVRIELNAPTVTVQGQTLDLTATAAASVNGGMQCSIQGAVVRIN